LEKKCIDKYKRVFKNAIKVIYYFLQFTSRTLF